MIRVRGNLRCISCTKFNKHGLLSNDSMVTLRCNSIGKKYWGEVT